MSVQCGVTISILMITYTGIITLIFMYFPYAMLTTFDGDFNKFYQQTHPTQQHVEVTGRHQWQISVDVRQLQQLKPDVSISRVTVSILMTAQQPWY